MQAAVLGEAIGQLSRTGADPDERRKFVAALVLALPSLARADIDALMSQIDGADPRLDFFHLTGAIRRRLDTRRPEQTPADVIARLSLRDFERAAHENRRRTTPPEHFRSEQILSALLALAHASGVLSPWGRALEISTEPYGKRVATWNAQLDAWDRQAFGLSHSVTPATALPRAPVKCPDEAGIVSASVVPPANQSRVSAPDPRPDSPGRAARMWPHAEARHVNLVSAGNARNGEGHGLLPGVMAEMDDVIEMVSRGDARKMSADPSDPLLDSGVAIASWGVGAAVRAGVQSRTVHVAGIGLSVTATLVVLRYVYEWCRTWLGNAPDIEALPVSEAQAAGQITLSSYDLRNRFDLEQILTLTEWLAVNNSDSAIRQTAATYMDTLVTSVLAHRLNLTRDAAALFPANANISVTFREVSFLSLGYATGGAAASLTRQQNFTLQEIAVGRHYLDEFMKLGGVRHVVSVRPADDTPNVRRFLEKVNTDAFRQELHDADVLRLEVLSRSPQALSAFSLYIGTRIYGLLWRALSAEGIPAWAASLGESAFQRRAGAPQPRLVTFQGNVVAGMLALRKSDGNAALLLSVRHGEWLWWQRETAAHEPFQTFMKRHLTLREQTLIDRPFRINALQFQFAEPYGPVDVDPAESLPRTPRTWYETIGALFGRDFDFRGNQTLEYALWDAEIRSLRENMDVTIVTHEWRDHRDRTELARAMLQGTTGTLFPLLFGAFPLAPWVVPTVLAGGAAAGAVNLVMIVKSASHGDLARLRRAHHDFKFGAVMMFIHGLPIGTPVERVCRAVFTYVGTASRELTRQADEVIRTSLIVESTELEWVERARALAVHVAAHGETTQLKQERPWDTMVRLRSGGETAIYRTMTISGRAASGEAQAVLGGFPLRVETQDQLLRLPKGYLFAIANTTGSMSFTGVTYGGGVVFGKCTDAGNTAVRPIFRRFDFGTADAMTFLDGGCVEFRGVPVDVLIEETLRQRLPPLALPALEAMPPLGGRSCRPMTARSETTQSTPRASVPPPDDPVTQNRSIVLTRWSNEFSQDWQRGAVSYETSRRWADIVSRWRANCDDASRQRLPVGAKALTVIDYRAHATMAEADLLPTVKAIRDSWYMPEFTEALADVMARVESGLMLWHLPRVAPNFKALILMRLQGEPLCLAHLAEVDPPGTHPPHTAALEGVVGLRRGEFHLMFSLRTGEVLTWTGSARVRGRGALQNFIARHLSERDVAEYSEVLAESGGLHVGESKIHVSLVASQDAHTTLAHAMRDWLLSDVPCRARTHARARCARIEKDDDMLYLVAYAANVLPQYRRDALVSAVQRIVGPGSERRIRLPQRYRDAPDGVEPQVNPDLPFAHFLGVSIRDFAADIFGPVNGTATPDLASQLAVRFMQTRLPHYVSHVAHRDVAQLVGSGAGNATFGNALLAASRPFCSGRFAAVANVLLDDVLSVADRKGELVNITDLDALMAIPAGYRVFLADPSVLRRGPDILSDMVSLGAGAMAAWRRSAFLDVPPPVYDRVDLTTPNELMSFVNGSFQLASGRAVGVWAEKNTPGLYADPRFPREREGEVDGSELLGNLTRLTSVSDALRHGVKPNLTSLLPDVRAVMEHHFATDIRYRLVLSWSDPLQRKPHTNIALTGVAGRRLQRSPASCRVVVDLFAIYVLGSQFGVSSVGYVVSEAAWQREYLKYAGDRCIKYIDFDDMAAAVAAAATYCASPGVQPDERQSRAFLLHAPRWTNPLQPGWHQRQQ
ncbi:hypothetical protein [Pandoraea norimbergensis]|uniref:hypothetical protein n=1 Tax=Pandoraea norimbergensis TaxID=93219 RepID=UPI0012F50F67|nr:hypothetical protein [Pandoraea norimbergensis]